MDSLLDWTIVNDSVTFRLLIILIFTDGLWAKHIAWRVRTHVLDHDNVRNELDDDDESF